MARLPRLSLAGYPHHVMLRGNNRQPIFASSADQAWLLALIDENARKFKLALHAYVLMGNHFHLLLTPETDEGLSRMMQAVGRRYVRYFNDRQGRTGSLWEGRYRSTVVQSDRYLLACMAYIDLNPVRAGLAADPESYPWSSYAHYAGLRTDRLLTPHPLFWSLGNTPFAREAAYAEMVRAGLVADQESAIRQSLLGGWALGEGKFVANLQTQTPRRVTRAVAGRPPKRPDPAE